MRFLDLSLPTVHENVALDEALVIAADEGTIGSTLRIWDLDHHAVVLGASGKLAEDVRLNHCQADQVTIARRSSGGGTVLLGPGTVNFTVVIPIDIEPALRAVDTAQVWVLERAAAGLRALDPDVQVLGSGDLTRDGRKFSGSAQRRLKRYLMVHASVILELDIASVDRYLNPPQREPVYRAGRSHKNFLTELGFSRNEMVGALRSAWDASDPLETAPIDLASRLVAEKFGRVDWIERM